jgi:hypothetical protein
MFDALVDATRALAGAGKAQPARGGSPE